MAYRDFTLKQIKNSFLVNINQVENLFENVTPRENISLNNTISKHLNLALAVGTTKARSECLISPILLEIKDILEDKISLFSGVDFTIDDSKGLNGICDFIISKSSQQILIEAPIVLIVKTKRHDLNEGLGQCLASMIASQKFNKQNRTIHGCVTTGDRWKFIKVENQTVTIELIEHSITPVDQVLGILLSILE